MRKLCILLLCFTLTFSCVGCGEKETLWKIPENTTDVDQNSENKTDSIEPEVKSENLGLTLETLKDLYNGNQDITFEDFLKYETQEYDVFKEKDSYGTVCFAASGDSEIGVVYFLANSNGAQQHKNKVAQKRAVIADYCDKAGIEYNTSEKVEDDILIIAIAAKDSALNGKNLSPTIQQFRDKNEFFSDDERRTQYQNFLRSMDYAGLADYLLNFVQSNDVTANDNVEQLLEYAEQLSLLLNECTVQRDEFEGTAQIYYSGAQQLSSEINVVPFGQTSTRGESLSFYCNTGIVRSNWLFFDYLALKDANDIIEKANPSYDSVNREVLGNGNITEWLNMSQWKSGFQQIIEDNAGTIRFENTETGETVDHTITTAELSALYTILQIDYYHNALAHEIFLWEHM